MRICMLGDFSPNRDEGFKNTSHQLAQRLSTRNEVVTLNIWEARRTEFWRKLRAARPEIVHIISQPTSSALLLSRMIRTVKPRSKVVVSALKPEAYFRSGKASFGQQYVLRLAAPDLMLAQNHGMVARLRGSVRAAKYLPSGVDLARSQPPTEARKIELREEHGLDGARPVVLHVGHLNHERNLPALECLAESGFQVLFVGTTYMVSRGYVDANWTAAAVDRLRSAGCVVVVGYQPRIEEIYSLSDCYVFPLAPGKSISMPLSVLEAMATNLPIVTARYPGLTDAFTEAPDFRYLDGVDELPALVKSVLSAGEAVSTRERVAQFSWDSVVDTLTEHYEGLLAA